MENLGTEKLAEAQTDIEDLVRRCDLSKEMQVLIGYYIMMEEYYMREMADKVTNAIAAALCMHRILKASSENTMSGRNSKHLIHVIK